MSDGRNDGEQVGLALSGGGFRAALFHLGSLTRLNELGWLRRLSLISACSGGAITAAWLGLRWGELRFDERGVAAAFDREVTAPLRRFCSRDHDTLPSLLNMAAQLIGHPTRALAREMRSLVGEAKLADLPAAGDGPRILLTASNLVTGSLVHIDREGLTDPRLGRAELADLPLAEAVAASCAFPPFLSPCVIATDPARWQPLADADLAADESLRRRLVLSDGGLHDPAALEPLGGVGTVLVSNANVTRERWRRPTSFWTRQSGRATILQTVANALARVRDLRRRFLAPDDPLRGAAWNIADRVADFGASGPAWPDSDETRAVCSLRTRLSRFSDSEQRSLINWGYSLCDAAMRASLGAANEPAAKLPV